MREFPGVPHRHDPRSPRAAAFRGRGSKRKFPARDVMGPMRAGTRRAARPITSPALTPGASLHTMQSLISNLGAPMASITIRNLDAQTKARLRVRAAHHSRSMEEEARNILRAALAEAEATPRNLADAIRARFQPLGGIDLKLPAREPMRAPPKPGR